MILKHYLNIAIAIIIGTTSSAIIAMHLDKQEAYELSKYTDKYGYIPGESANLLHFWQPDTPYAAEEPELVTYFETPRSPYNPDSIQSQSVATTHIPLINNGASTITMHPSYYAPAFAESYGGHGKASDYTKVSSDKSKDRSYYAEASDYTKISQVFAEATTVPCEASCEAWAGKLSDKSKDRECVVQNAHTLSSVGTRKRSYGWKYQHNSRATWINTLDTGPQIPEEIQDKIVSKLRKKPENKVCNLGTLVTLRYQYLLMRYQSVLEGKSRETVINFLKNQNIKAPVSEKQIQGAWRCMHKYHPEIEPILKELAEKSIYFQK
jgi:hypothetical protein